MWSCIRSSSTDGCPKCSGLKQQLTEARASLIFQNETHAKTDGEREKQFESMGRRLRRPTEVILDLCDGLIHDESIPEEALPRVGHIAQLAQQLLIGIKDSNNMHSSLRVCSENSTFVFHETLNMVIDAVSRRFRGKEIEFERNVDVEIPKLLAGDVSILRQCLTYILDTLLGMAEHSDSLIVHARRVKQSNYITLSCNFRLRSGPSTELVDVNDPNEPNDLIYGHLAMQLGGKIRRSASYCAFNLTLNFRASLPEPNQPACSGGKILVYEDNTILLKTFQHVLCTKGGSVEVIKSLGELVNLASIVDLHRAYMCFIVSDDEVGASMIEAVRSIERSSGTKRLPILLSVPNHRNESESKGGPDVDDFVVKPCSGEAILKRIRHLVTDSTAQSGSSGTQSLQVTG